MLVPVARCQLCDILSSHQRGRRIIPSEGEYTPMQTPEQEVEEQLRPRELLLDESEVAHLDPMSLLLLTGYTTN